MAILLAILGWLGLVVIASLILALPVMWLWDYTMPSLFGTPEITWLQATALLILCNFLFKASYSTKS